MSVNAHVVQYMCTPPVSARHASMLVWISLADWFPAWDSSCFLFYSPRLVAKGGRLELLGGCRSEKWQHPGVRGEMEPPIKQGILHCTPPRPTKIVAVSQVWKIHALWLPLVFHDTMRTHAELKKRRNWWMLCYPQGRRDGERKRKNLKDKGERQKMERGEKTEQCSSMQMASFIACSIILIISYSNSSG